MKNTNPNPFCPHCGGATYSHGRTSANQRRYRCSVCLKTHVVAPLPPGPAPLEGVALSAGERMKRYRARLKAWNEARG